MRAVLTLVSVAVLPAIAAAQLPRDLGDFVRKMPSLDHPRNPRLKAYAFKTIRITRRGNGARPY
jgi:hypothetical protein